MTALVDDRAVRSGKRRSSVRRYWDAVKAGEA